VAGVGQAAQQGGIPLLLSGAAGAFVGTSVGGVALHGHMWTEYFVLRELLHPSHMSDPACFALDSEYLDQNIGAGTTTGAAGGAGGGAVTQTPPPGQTGGTQTTPPGQTGGTQTTPPGQTGAAEPPPRKPRHGDTTVEDDGCTYVFDGKHGQGWVDRRSWKELDGREQDNAEWRARSLEAERKQRADKAEQYRALLERKRQLKENLEKTDRMMKKQAQQSQLERLQASARLDEDLPAADVVVNAAEWIKWGNDQAATLVCAFGGGAGKLFYTGYTALQPTLQGAVSGAINPGESAKAEAWRGFKWGAKEATYNLVAGYVFDKTLVPVVKKVPGKIWNWGARKVGAPEASKAFAFNLKDPVHRWVKTGFDWTGQGIYGLSNLGISHQIHKNAD
jgi:hypothetical protein